MSNAAQTAEAARRRSLNGVHLAAARQARPNTTVLTFVLTFDAQQAHVARLLDLTTIGATRTGRCRLV